MALTEVNHLRSEKITLTFWLFHNAKPGDLRIAQFNNSSTTIMTTMEINKLMVAFLDIREQNQNISVNADKAQLSNRPCETNAKINRKIHVINFTVGLIR
jgi:uncharacterized membrane protein